MKAMRHVLVASLVACSGPAVTHAPPAPAPAQPISEAPVVPPPITDQACFPAPVVVEAPPDAAPAVADEPPPPSPRRARKAPFDACLVAESNILRDEAEIVKTRSTAAALPVAPWNHKAPPQRLDLVQRRFELQPNELDLLAKNGFAVPARLEMPSYAYAYHEIYQSQLPVLITADSLFHAIFASHDAIVEELEDRKLAKLLATALDRMHCALPAAVADYPRDVARDVDLYLVVARTLAGSGKVGSLLGDASVDRDAAAILAEIQTASGAAQVSLFGRPRLVDFTQYLPRGHYAKTDDLQHYFRAAMWASRLEFNLVSRSSRSSAPGPRPDPTETPREAIAALALADLATRASASADLATLDEAWAVLAGRREDVSLAQLADLRKAANITSLRDPNAFDALKATIGAKFQRTTAIHPMPEGTTTLPAIATLIGPRIVPDAQAIMPIVNTRVPDRNKIAIADVAYSLGDDHAKRYLARDLATFPNLGAQLEIARKLDRDAVLGDDLYSAWFVAIRALAAPVEGTQPSYAMTEAGADLRLDTIAAAYGQLKHNYVLMAGQPYSAFGCEIPDGYIEPVPKAYDGLIQYADRGAKLAAILDPTDEHGFKLHFTRVAQVMRVIRAIVDDELANRPLTAIEKRWIGMVAELSVDKSQDITGYPPVYSGWYFDLFRDPEGDGMRGAGFIADYFTSVEDGIAYAGAKSPRIGVFVVDTGGAPRAFVGPVAHAFQHQTPLDKRLTDADAAKLAQVDEPWAQSYAIANPAQPPDVELSFTDKGVVITAPQALGAATIKVLDHHRVPLDTKRITIGKGETVVPVRRNRDVNAVYIEIGAFHDWVVGDSYGQINRAWGKAAASDQE